MPGKEQIIMQINADKEYLQIAKNVSHSSRWAEDLYQEIMICLLRMPNDKLLALHARGELKPFIGGMMTRIWNSSKSKLSHYVRRREHPYEKLPQVIFEDYDERQEEIDKHIDIVLNELEQLQADRETWYCATLFKLAVEQGSNRKASVLTGIPRASVNMAINEVRRHIKSKLI